MAMSTALPASPLLNFERDVSNLQRTKPLVVQPALAPSPVQKQAPVVRKPVKTMEQVRFLLMSLFSIFVS